jgi:malto-oligosyltrehalose trehalohydrolase
MKDMDETDGATWGAHVMPDGSTRFRIWAPAQARMILRLETNGEEIALDACKEGWHEIVTTRARAGSRYRFKLADGTLVPDPASRFQPEDVAGPSEVIDNSYAWQTRDWRGRPWNTAVIYEVHVGAFTPAGTFEALAERIPYLRDLGITAIQLMPIADFAGRHNWGYDGVLPYAPDSAYGRPEQLKALVDAAHAHGLMMFLDVVYNHFGPEGNYLGLYAPGFFTERHHTPWGAAINFDGPEARPVRDFVVGNALYWLEEFQFDGLRLDAVHHLLDDSPTHILRELAETVRARLPQREIHLILENEENQASLLTRDPDGRAPHYTAQWNDDFHHVLHTALTEEAHGYYRDYLHDDAKLVRAVTEGFAFQGETMQFRGSPRGEPSAHLPPLAFVSFLQNHDQIGNRAFGERLGTLASQDALRAASALYLLLPHIPMLFMGEEWGATEPFVFFCDFKGELALAIRDGRRREFASFPAFRAGHGAREIPDPDDPKTFASAKLDWDRRRQPGESAALRRYRELLAVRGREIVPRLPFISGAARGEPLADRAFRVVWRVGSSEHLALTANLSGQSQSQAPFEMGRILWSEGSCKPGSPLPPWSVIWSLEGASARV